MQRLPRRCSRGGGIKGRQAQRGGDGRTAFPWSASEARSAAGAKASAPGAAEKRRVAPKDNAPDVAAISAQSSPATARSRRVQRTRMAACPRSGR
ncbi:hypothetical protein E6C76_05920 [Pseudothauera nasutitermitis]|uniref:Uncharacterized protein n=1 Tax=Pseudothauera nasutitermitis TaxID=2565930 RepID=A0A4S4B5X2_9RHOO|nr:hypothetical protein E6C76_05920 [Pseudothauera nasutitermitis]